MKMYAFLGMACLYAGDVFSIDLTCGCPSRKPAPLMQVKQELGLVLGGIRTLSNGSNSFSGTIGSMQPVLGSGLIYRTQWGKVQVRAGLEMFTANIQQTIGQREKSSYFYHRQGKYDGREVRLGFDVAHKASKVHVLAGLDLVAGRNRQVGNEESYGGITGAYRNASFRDIQAYGGIAPLLGIRIGIGEKNKWLLGAESNAFIGMQKNMQGNESADWVFQMQPIRAFTISRVF